MHCCLHVLAWNLSVLECLQACDNRYVCAKHGSLVTSKMPTCRSAAKKVAIQNQHGWSWRPLDRQGRDMNITEWTRINMTTTRHTILTNNHRPSEIFYILRIDLTCHWNSQDERHKWQSTCRNRTQSTEKTSQLLLRPMKTQTRIHMVPSKSFTD